MYYNSYEDYMRNGQGYGYDSFNNGFIGNMYPIYNDYNRGQEIDYESMFPAVYNTINPMVESNCLKYQNSRVSKDIIEEIADKVYIQYIESGKRDESRTDSLRTTAPSNIKKEETRSGRNDLLMDLIRILIIKNLISNRPNRPGRPPIRPNPGMSPCSNCQNMPPQYGQMFY